MQISVLATFNQATEAKCREKSVVVIDLLRATTTMINAVVNGSHKVIPVCEIDEAMAMKRTLDKRDSVLAGERNGQIIEGFDLGNSPQEFTAEKVKGKTVVVTTTNGTRALVQSRNAQMVVLGALINCAAVAKLLNQEKRDVTMICAGTDGNFSADDIYCAGAIIDELKKLNEDLNICDLGNLAHNYYKCAKNDRSLLENTFHYKHLMDMNLKADIDFCFNMNTTDIVPRYKNGIVEKE